MCGSTLNQNSLCQAATRIIAAMLFFNEEKKNRLWLTLWFDTPCYGDNDGMSTLYVNRQYVYVVDKDPEEELFDEQSNILENLHGRSLLYLTTIWRMELSL
jgi:hypothetical protein